MWTLLHPYFGTIQGKMSQPNNLYMKKPNNILTANDDNISMHESSLSSKISGSEKDNNDAATVADDPPQEKNCMEEEEINFEDTHFQIPPSFNQPINEETLQDDNWPYVFGHP